MRFLGNIEARLDAKGRVFLPAAFRKELQTEGLESLVMRKDVFQPCLVLYPERVWNAQMDELRARLSPWNKREQMIFRTFVSDVERLPLDGSGRLLLPKRYLEKAAIGQQVAFIGMGDTIEVWAAAGSEPFMPADEFASALEQLMAREANAAIED